MALPVEIKLLDPKAQVPFKKEGRETDFCYDCVAVSEEEIAPNVWKYGLGFALQVLPTPTLAMMGFNLRARSSVWETGMVLSNGQGTVDRDYTGEISAVFYHVMPDMPRYKVGDKVCQICLEDTVKLDFDIVSDFRVVTRRGENGYGSSGR